MFPIHDFPGANHYKSIKQASLISSFQICVHGSDGAAEFSGAQAADAPPRGPGGGVQVRARDHAKRRHLDHSEQEELIRHIPACHTQPRRTL